MTQQIDVNGFVEFLTNMEKNVQKEVFVENVDGDVESVPFIKIDFNRSTVVLYENPVCSVGIIQDTPVAPFEDYVKEVFYDLENEGENRVMVEK